MSDGKKQLGYLWYSQGGAPTAPAVAEALGLHCGMKQPEDYSQYSVVWAWGARLPEKLREKSIRTAAEAGTRFLNPIKAVSGAKNRQGLLARWAAAKVPTLPIVAVEIGRDGAGMAHFRTPNGVLDLGKLVYPCVFQDALHTFTSPLCCSPSDINAIRPLLAAGGPQAALTAGYFRPLLSGTEEYRVHLFCTQPVMVERRTRAGTFEEACRREVGEACGKVSGANVPAAVQEALAKQFTGAFGFLGNSPALAGSNWGWETKAISLGHVPKEVLSAAVSAFQVAELDTGVVSVFCNLNRLGRPELVMVASCSTAPSLNAEGQAAYVQAFRRFQQSLNPAAAPVPVAAPPQADRQVAAGLADRQARRAAILAAALQASEEDDNLNAEQVVAAIRGATRRRG